MNRRHRVQYPNALYHVTSRGVRRGTLFEDDTDRRLFLNRIAGAVSRLGWLVYAFTLMSNHFHLFFRTPRPDLCQGMQWLLGGYARAYNRRHGLSGHVFEARFRCGVVEDETYAWTVSRYVHLNPVPALARHPNAWPWSSYPGYCDPARRLPWVCYDQWLEAWQGAFGGDALAGYRRYVESALPGCCPSPFDSAADGWILGSEQFVERIRGLISPASRQPSAKQARRIPTVSMPQIIGATCQVCELTPEQLRVRGRRTTPRAIVAYLARRHSAATHQDIAVHLGLSRPDSVPSLLQKVTRAVSEKRSPQLNCGSSLLQTLHRVCCLLNLPKP